MATDYKPLFNPLYLKGVIIILPLLIVLLASMGPAPERYPLIHRDAAHQLYWIEQTERTDNELRLLLRTPLALNPEQKVLQQAMAELLQHRLRQPSLQSLLPPASHADATAMPDHMQIRLRWPTGVPLPALLPLLQALAQPADAEGLQTSVARLRARAYLEGQDPAQQLLNRFQAQLQNVPPALVSRVQQHYLQLFEQAPYLVLGGPDAITLAAQLRAATPSGHARRPPERPSIRSDARQLHLDDARQPAMRLTGEATGGRDAEDYAVQLLAITSLRRLLELQDSTRLSYRLVWQPLHGVGFRALILGDSPLPPSALTAALDSALILDTREKLLQRLREWLQTPDGQLEQLTTLAFNALDTERLDSLLDALENVREDDIAPRIAHYLDPDAQILITLNGQ